MPEYAKKMREAFRGEDDDEDEEGTWDKIKAQMSALSQLRGSSLGSKISKGIKKRKGG